MEKDDRQEPMNKVKFCVFADVHVDHSPLSMEFFEQMMADLSSRPVDFVIALGDIGVVRPWIAEYVKNPAGTVIPEEHLKNLDYHLEYYARFRRICEALPGLYKVLGNHDHDAATKEEVCRALGLASPYYSFEVNGFHFIVLDTNHYVADGELMPYGRKNYQLDKTPDKHTEALGRPQLQWLRAELARSEGPVVIFSHASLAEQVYEREELAALLRDAGQAGKRIFLCVNGHRHIDRLLKLEDVWYWDVNSMTYRFLGTKWPCERFSPDVHRQYPRIKYAAHYDRPLYAYVTIAEDGKITVEGRQAAYIKPSPEALGFPDSQTRPSGPYILNRCFYASDSVKF